MVEELKISQIPKQCKLLACTRSHVIVLSKIFSGSYFAVKYEEKTEHVSVSLDFSHLKVSHRN